MPATPPIVIGTRGSPLAMAQAKEAQARLAAALGWDIARLTLRPFTTTGDVIQDRALAEAGGKGLFTKELDAALLDGRIDLAVHSAKDLPTFLPEGLVIAGYLPREDVRDVFISPLAGSLATLPAGTVVGTASPRRQAQVLRARPDLKVALLRGNVGTRLQKLERGEAGATLLALAGLKRLGMESHATRIFSTDEMLPAVGQGAIAVTTRAEDARLREAVGRISHAETEASLTLERAFLAVLDGSCRTPIAGHARISGETVRFRGLVLRPDGTDAVEIASEGQARDAAEIGMRAGHDIKARLPGGMLQA
ncbi:hydroxymethylbilane synthase [Enterovirga sp. DB1703]|uniref:Porphobilinogen deaminase n=1 Tax=Enterovirga aerilata TaxID=2730920 RepID=A0A849IDB7_9HYPH|nr:hydroxymethylbilane synthase [Enterovirga sp. DB1703]NNM73977.1 hydroxymethylbilane synthase [Enterovirga sp. DB1703]